jgi:hypothetical protein
VIVFSVPYSGVLTLEAVAFSELTSEPAPERIFLDAGATNFD